MSDVSIPLFIAKLLSHPCQITVIHDVKISVYINNCLLRYIIYFEGLFQTQLQDLICLLQYYYHFSA